ISRVPLLAMLRCRPSWSTSIFFFFGTGADFESAGVGRGAGLPSVLDSGLSARMLGVAADGTAFLAGTGGAPRGAGGGRGARRAGGEGVGRGAGALGFARGVGAGAPDGVELATPAFFAFAAARSAAHVGHRTRRDVTSTSRSGSGNDTPQFSQVCMEWDVR